MSCDKHPGSGEIILGDGEICYGCYCEQFEYCPLCGRKWDDPLECKKGEIATEGKERSNGNSS